MKKILINLNLLIAVLATLYISGAFTMVMPGVVYEIDVTDHEQSPPKTESIEMAVEGRNLKMGIASSGGESGRGTMIFNGDKGKHGEVVIVDDDQKSYYVMDDAFFNAMKRQVEEASTLMDQMLEGLPKEQRDAIEKARQNGGPGVGTLGPMKPRSKPEIHNTGERATKQGYPCVKYEVFQDGKKIREIWTTDWDNIDGGDEAKGAWEGFGKFFKAVWETLGEMPGGEDPFGGESLYDEMNFENGFPVVTSSFGEDGELEDESALKGARRGRLDPAEFEPPSGYKRMSMGPQ